MGMTAEGYIDLHTTQISQLLEPIASGDIEFSDQEFERIKRFNQFVALNGSHAQRTAYFHTLNGAREIMSENLNENIIATTSEFNALSWLTAEFSRLCMQNNAHLISIADNSHHESNRSMRMGR